MPEKSDQLPTYGQLKNENELFKAALNASLMGIVITDNLEPDNPIIYCNDAFEELTGYARDEIVGRNCRFLQNEDRQQDSRSLLRKALKDDEYCKVEMRNYRKNGTPFINELSISPIFNEQNKVTHYIGIQNNISRRKKLESLLKNEQQRLEDKIGDKILKLEDSREYHASIVETIRESLVVLDKTCCVISANENFFKTFKVEREDVIGQNFFELSNGQWNIEPLKNLINKILPHNNPFENFIVEHDFPHLGKRLMILNARQIVSDGDFRDRILLAMEDATDRIDSERRKDDFLSMASHELKTPLTSIKGYTQIAQRLISQKEAKLTEVFGKVVKNVDHLSQLVADLLDISKINAGKVELAKSTFKFETIITEAISIVLHAENKHKIEISGEIELEFYGDKLRLEQVLVNLFSNAIKYSPDQFKIKVHVSKVTDVVKVSVTDYGVGIDIHDQKKIFEKFYRADEIQHLYPGMGIGLYFCDQMIALHNGHFWVDSELQKGSVFSFTLPFKSE